MLHELPASGMVKLYSHYERHEKIGEGTFAIVYTGRAIFTSATLEDRGGSLKVKGAVTVKKEEKSKAAAAAGAALGPKIAIKKIKHSSLVQEGLDMSAIREIKYLQALKHPNIINLMDVVVSDGAGGKGLNLVLEFLDADMEMIIKNGSVVFSPSHIKAWMMMLFRGVHFCHSNYILHRDLKPNNLLLARDGTLKIADFGLARFFGDPSQLMTSQVVTRWYRAPELLLGAQHYGGGVDVWSCGCIFAELMLRTPYFASETDIGQLTVIFRARGTPTEADWPGVKLLPLFFDLPIYAATPLRALFSAAGEDALQLLDLLLKYDPLKRPTALGALEHPYFTNFPRPSPNDKLPRDSSNAASKRRISVDEEEEDDTPNMKRQKVSRKLF